MATLATMFDRLFARDLDRSRPSLRATDASIQLRAIANEDIYLFTKRIDNSRVVREADPKARGVCWKLIGSVVAAVVLLIGVLLPSAYGLLAGYQIQSLRQEGQRLATEQGSLELQETQLLSPARMEELARIQQFVDPPPQRVVYLENRGSLAMK
jgi:hypothetical protein